MRVGRALVFASALMAGSAVGAARPSPDKVIASIDLSKAFATRSPWRFTATQRPDIDDPIFGEGKVSGPVHLCISKDGGRSCNPSFREPLRMDSGEDFFADAHMLRESRIVYPQDTGGRALLLLHFASLQSANGDAREGLQLLAYDRARDLFSIVFSNVTGHNNNQENRYIAEGPLKGAVVIAEPTGNAPFGFWITVNRLTPAFTYRRVLRFRSATRYGDGNPLATIDSEMPNIQQRLGLWRPGKPLPTPGKCAKPHLVKMELWCG